MHLGKIKRLIENNPGGTMITSSLLGLAFPYGDLIPNATIIVLLGIVIFLSCFKINTPLRAIRPRFPIIFWVLRYAVIPAMLWFTCKKIVPAYALGVLLLGLCPAGVSSAALAGIYNGNVTLAFVITILSNAGSVFLIPAMVAALNHQAVAVPPLDILKTLTLCILLPGILYVPSRRQPLLINFSRHYGRLAAILMMSMTVFIVLSKKRDYIVAHFQDMITAVFIAAAFYAVTMFVSFLIRTKPADRITYGVCSTFNNSGLGIGLALMYFDEKTIAIMLAAEIVWSFLPMFAQPAIKYLEFKTPDPS
jgi:BASS family bile acid:Na+ symporter